MLAELRFKLWRWWKVKPDWKLTRPVERCRFCGDPVKPIAYHTGDGWWLHWACECGEVYAEDMEWPFRKNWASADDLGRLGFEIL